jgi:mannose-6-phosphate isomerase-like protein (cupin superfamily)
MSEANDELRGAPKKEAFHQAAEAGIVNFKFDKPAQDIPHGKKAHVKLAGTNSCRASVQVLNQGGENNLHYHPNMDLIYMVLKGRVQFYGPEGKLWGDYGPNEGLLLPENSRYWFKSVGEEEAWLLQIAGYPKGAEMSKRIPLEPARADAGGVWFGLTDHEEDVRRRNNRL